MMKYEFLRIQHHLSSIYANKNQEIEKVLNKINADLNHLIHLTKKNQLQLDDYIEEMKNVRENVYPDKEEIMSLYDTYIYDLEALARSK